MIDSDGDENYVPYIIPLDGGFPEPLAAEAFADGRSHLIEVDDDAEIAYFAVESREEPSIARDRCDLATGTAETLWREPVRRVRRPRGAATTRASCSPTVHDGRRRALRARGAAGARCSTARRSTSAIPGATTRSPGFGRRHMHAERARHPAHDDALRRRRLARATSTSRGRARSSPSRSTASCTRAQASSRGSTTSRATGTRSIYNIDGCSWAYAGTLRRGGAHVHGRPRARGRGRPRRRRPARARLRRGERPLRAVVLHRDEPDAALRAPGRGRRRRAADARARAGPRARAAVGRRGRLVRVARRPARLGASLPAVAASSATRARGRSSTTSTAARRARSGRTSRGSRCR